MTVRCRDHQAKRTLLHEVGSHIAAGFITAEEIRRLAPAEHPYRASTRQLQTFAEAVAAVVIGSDPDEVSS